MSREAVRGATYPLRLGVALLVLALGMSACGSSGKRGDTKPSPTPSATATATAVGGKVDRRPVAVEVRVPGKTDFGDSTESKPGDYVQLRALVRTPADSPGRNLTISVARRDSGPLKVRARPTSGGKGSTATVSGASNRSIRLTDLRYSCFAPPAATFCPLDSVKASRSRYVVKAKVQRGRPVVLTFTTRSGS
jgi:hypothetical protein